MRRQKKSPLGVAPTSRSQKGYRRLGRNALRSHFSKYLCSHGNACGYCKKCGDSTAVHKVPKQMRKYLCKHGEAVGYCAACPQTGAIIDRSITILPEVNFYKGEELMSVRVDAPSIPHEVTGVILPEAQVQVVQQIHAQLPDEPPVVVGEVVVEVLEPRMLHPSLDIASTYLVGDGPIEFEEEICESEVLQCGCRIRSSHQRMLDVAYDALFFNFAKIPHSCKELHECPKHEIERLARENRLDPEILGAVAWTALGVPTDIAAFRSQKNMFKQQASKVMGNDPSDLELYNYFISCKRALVRSTWAERSLWYEVGDNILPRSVLNKVYMDGELPSPWWSWNRRVDAH